MLYEYIKEAGTIPLLSWEEEKSLVEILRNRSSESEKAEARQRLVKGCLRAAVGLALRYYYKNDYLKNKGFDFCDVVQEGNLGLLEAVARFKPNGGRFLTYAAYWIKGRIKRCARARSSPASIDDSIGGDSGSLKDCIENACSETPAEAVEKREKEYIVRVCLKELNQQEQAVLVCRYFECYSLQATGAMIGRTAERVRQIEDAAKRKLRRRIKARFRF